MKILEKFKDFISSDKNETLFYTEFDQTWYLFKYPLKNDIGYALYRTRFQLSKTSANSLSYLMSIDKDLNVIHINDDIFKNREIDYWCRGLYKEDYEEILDKVNFYDLKNFNDKQFKNVETDFRNILKKQLNALNTQLDKKYNYNDFKDLAKEKYKEKINYKHPVDNINFDLSIDIVSDYYTNKLEEHAWDYIDNQLKNQYIEYYNATKAIADYEKELEKDPVLKKNKEIVDILLNDKYKSFRIFYTLPTGDKKVFSYKKGTKKYGNVNKDIMDFNIIYNIPICAIDKIMYRKDILFDGGEEKYDYKKLALEYSKATQDPYYKEILQSFGDDEEVVFQTIVNQMRNKSIYYNEQFPTIYKDKNISSSINCNFDFFKKIIDVLEKDTKNNYFLPFDQVPEELYLSKEFLMLVLDNPSKFYYKSKYFNEIYTKNPKILDKTILLKTINSNDLDILSDLIYCFDDDLFKDEYILNKLGTCIDEIDQQYKKSKYFEMTNFLDLFKSCAIKNINIEWMKKHFTTEPISIKLDSMPKTVIENKEYTKFLLNKGAAIGTNSDVLSLYKDDIHMHQFLVKGLNFNTVGGRSLSQEIEDFTRILNRNTRDDLLEFSSINPIFLNALTNVEKEVFFENEILNIENIKINKFDELIIKTSFGEFCYFPEKKLEFRTSDYKCDIENRKKRECLLSLYGFSINENDKDIQNISSLFKQEINNIYPSMQTELDIFDFLKSLYDNLKSEKIPIYDNSNLENISDLNESR